MRKLLFLMLLASKVSFAGASQETNTGQEDPYSKYFFRASKRDETIEDFRQVYAIANESWPQWFKQTFLGDKENEEDAQLLYSYLQDCISYSSRGKKEHCLEALRITNALINRLYMRGPKEENEKRLLKVLNTGDNYARECAKENLKRRLKKKDRKRYYEEMARLEE